MRTFFFISVLVLLAGALAACGGGSAEPAAPADSGSSDEVNIAVETSPNPAAMGDVELVLTIIDAQGNPIEGATVDVEVDHTDMTGMGMNGAATDQGGGRYSINANFSMSGNWKLTVYVRKDGLDVQQDIDLKIQ
ncbi:MAG TPA: FixH family protein [Anaerolineales bacterium]|nr:FixH family protein [Anaerolineales bacterium]